MSWSRKRRLHRPETTTHPPQAFVAVHRLRLSFQPTSGDNRYDGETRGTRLTGRCSNSRPQQVQSSLLTTSGPTRSPASGGLSRPPGPPSGTCHPIARTSIPSSSASRSSRPSFAPHAVAAVRRSGRSLVPVSSASALTNAATIFGTAGTQPPHGHEKRSNRTIRGEGGPRIEAHGPAARKEAMACVSALPIDRRRPYRRRRPGARIQPG